MIPGVVHLTSKTIYGFTARNHPLYLFKPFDVSLPDMLVGSSEPDRTKNILVLVNVLEELRNPPRGFIIRVLGKCGDKHAEEEAILYRYCPEQWKKTNAILPPVSATRKLIDVPFTVNIDPPGCTDIDDCISIWQEKSTKTMVNQILNMLIY
jgi:exoribonuclease R